jgi:MFS family permease
LKPGVLTLGGLWRDPAFLTVWLAASASAIGRQVSLLALPLTAVLMFGAGPAETGLLTAAGSAPMLLFGLFVGAWIDRLPRRPVRVIADLGSALVIGSLPAAALLGLLRLEHLYIAAFVGGTLAVCGRLALSALLPTLVGRERLLEANGKLMTTYSLSEIAGPPLGGGLVQAIGPPLALLADAVAYLVSGLSIWRLRLVEPKPKREPGASIWREIGEGLRWLHAHEVLFRLTVSIGLANLAWFGVQAVVIVFATRDLELSPTQLGVAMSAAGPASLLGAFLAARASRRFGLGPTMVTALSLEVVSRVVLVVAGGPPLMAAALVGLSYGLFGFLAPLWDVNANSLRQAMTPERLLGRVTAASTFVGVGTAPLGALLAGWLGEVAGPRVALASAAVITGLAVVCLVTSPVPRVKQPGSV